MIGDKGIVLSGGVRFEQMTPRELKALARLHKKFADALKKTGKVKATT